MKISKYILFIVVGVLVLNSLSWILIGQEKTLDLSLNFYNNYGPHPHTDTLFVYSKYTSELADGRILEYNDISGYNESTRESFLSELKNESRAKNIKFVDSTTRLFGNYEPLLLNYLVDIEYRFPFYINVYSGIFVNGFAADYDQNFIWFLNGGQLEKPVVVFPKLQHNKAF